MVVYWKCLQVKADNLDHYVILQLFVRKKLMWFADNLDILVLAELELLVVSGKKIE